MRTYLVEGRDVYLAEEFETLEEAIVKVLDTNNFFQHVISESLANIKVKTYRVFDFEDEHLRAVVRNSSEDHRKAVEYIISKRSDFQKKLKQQEADSAKLGAHIAREKTLSHRIEKWLDKYLCGCCFCQPEYGYAEQHLSHRTGPVRAFNGF